MAKKTFKESINPAINFISQESIDRAEERNTATEETVAKVIRPEKAPQGYKLNPLYIETKSKRLQLLIQPSLHEKLKARAKAKGTSVNDLVNSILYDALTEE
jgi:predicted HicB family RNase H-like nuclease